MPQAIIEIARVDRPREAFDHLRQREPLAGGDAAAPDRVGDRLYRAEDVGRAVDRRQSELDRAVAARRDGAVQTEPQSPWIPGEGKFDRLAAQRRRFAIEQQLRRPSRPVDRAARPPARIPRPPLRKRSTSTPFSSCCCCFLQGNIRHRSTSIVTLAPPLRCPLGMDIHMIMAILSLLHEAPKDEPTQQHDAANGFSNRSGGYPVSGRSPIVFVVGAGRPNKSPSLAEELVLSARLSDSRPLQNQKISANWKSIRRRWPTYAPMGLSRMAAYGRAIKRSPLCKLQMTLHRGVEVRLSEEALHAALDETAVRAHYRFWYAMAVSTRAAAYGVRSP